MNRRQKIIVSVIGIFIVLLALVGITYGYFLTRIQGNTNTTSITVTTADLKLVYGDGNGSVTPSGVIMPDNNNFIMFSNNTDSKTFTVTNDGNATVENYVVVLEDINVTYASNATLEDGTPVTLGQPTTFNRPQDFVYVLTCKAYTGYGTASQTELETGCNGVTTETILPMEDSILVTNTIDEDVTHAYELKIKYLNPDIDQSKDMNKTFSLKINIEDIRNFNPYKEGTLANAIFTNNKIKKNNNTPIFNGVATEEEGMYPASDDYGVSWYFRGAQPNNYVNFAGFMWRVVRINGDGSIRLILDGTLNKVSACDDTTICRATAFNSRDNDNAYVGYMYGFAGMTSNVCIKTAEDSSKSVGTETDESTCISAGGVWTSPYDATHMNLNNSTIKTQLDSFYQKYLNTYNDYISDTMFCGDKTLASNGIGGVTTQLGYGNGIDYQTYYAALGRLSYSTGTTSITNANPTLKCAEDADNTYSRYTVNGETTNKGTATNGDLTYPIALLSADELVMAGAFKETNNQSYYLYAASANWWTMSPGGFYGSHTSVFSFTATSTSVHYPNGMNDILVSNDSVHPGSYYGSRPVINLRSDILVGDGDGTSGSGAYIVNLPN